MPQSGMGVFIKSPVNLKCSTCGKIGTARVLSAASGKPRAAEVPEGFLIRLAQDLSFEIACSCGTGAHQFKFPAGSSSNNPTIGLKGTGWRQPWALWLRRQLGGAGLVVKPNGQGPALRRSRSIPRGSPTAGRHLDL